MDRSPFTRNFGFDVESVGTRHSHFGPSALHLASRLLTFASISHHPLHSTACSGPRKVRPIPPFRFILFSRMDRLPFTRNFGIDVESVGTRHSRFGPSALYPTSRLFTFASISHHPPHSTARSGPRKVRPIPPFVSFHFPTWIANRSPEISVLVIRCVPPFCDHPRLKSIGNPPGLAPSGCTRPLPSDRHSTPAQFRIPRPQPSPPLPDTSPTFPTFHHLQTHQECLYRTLRASLFRAINFSPQNSCRILQNPNLRFEDLHPCSPAIYSPRLSSTGIRSALQCQFTPNELPGKPLLVFCSADLVGGRQNFPRYVPMVSIASSTRTE